MRDKCQNPDSFVGIWVGQIPAKVAEFRPKLPESGTETAGILPDPGQSAGIQPFWPGFSGQIRSTGLFWPDLFVQLAVLAKSGLPTVLAEIRPDDQESELTRFRRQIQVTLAGCCRISVPTRFR
jgi:hypothetical protein